MTLLVVRFISGSSSHLWAEYERASNAPNPRRRLTLDLSFLILYAAAFVSITTVGSASHVLGIAASIPALALLWHAADLRHRRGVDIWWFWWPLDYLHLCVLGIAGIIATLPAQPTILFVPLHWWLALTGSVGILFADLRSQLEALGASADSEVEPRRVVVESVWALAFALLFAGFSWLGADASSRPSAAAFVVALTLAVRYAFGSAAHLKHAHVDASPARWKPGWRTGVLAAELTSLTCLAVPALYLFVAPTPSEFLLAGILLQAIALFRQSGMFALECLHDRGFRGAVAAGFNWTPINVAQLIAFGGVYMMQPAHNQRWEDARALPWVSLAVLALLLLVLDLREVSKSLGSPRAAGGPPNVHATN
jgi:hypothetical protein